MSSRKRVFTAASLLLRDGEGKPNSDAFRVFEEEYYRARVERLSVQAAAEIAMTRALGS